jgi:HEPN domain-containing protein
MSKPEHYREAVRWLRYAKEDLRAASALLGQPMVTPRHTCFLAQQAAEKGLKSVLIASQTKFPFRHDLDELRNLIPTHWSARNCAADLSELTEWAVEARYPTYEDDPTAEDAQRAVEQASIVVGCVLRDFQARGLA